ncbi:MAG: heme-binding protein [Rhodobacterales bacterium]|nr:heme-binding protein [Rhodobacterales bacterium]
MRWLLALVVTLGALTASEAQMYNGNETPAYTVDATDGAFELRRYPPHIAAEVTVSGSRDAAIRAGFRVLAGYIFGGNEAKARVAMTTPVSQSEKIDMTTPVTQTESAKGWTVQFMMPSKYTLETLPKPNDSRIRLVTTDPVRLAVLRFSGIPTTAALASRAEDLRGWAEGQGLTITAGPHYYFYDAPMTLPWKRRNEVAFTIR